MESANWGDLWDQVEAIAYHTQKGIDYLDKYGVFLKERSVIEEEYAAKLRALAKKNLPKKKEEEENPFSYGRSFFGILHELESLAGQHEVTAERFKRELQPAISSACIELKQQRKAHLSDFQQLQQRLSSTSDNMIKSQKNYNKAFKEAEAATLKYSKAEKNMDLSRAELERAKNNAHARSQQCDEAKQTYAYSLQITNEQQHRHFSVELPAVLEKLRLMDESRITQTKQMIEGSVLVESYLMPIIQRCYDDMLKITERIDPQSDSLMVVQRYRSGYAYPSPFVFEDLGCPSAVLSGGGLDQSISNGQKQMNGDSGTMKRHSKGSKGIHRKTSMSHKIFGHKNENSEDFSHLAPEQRCRKLREKIVNVEREIATKTQGRDGLLKMQQVYTEQPKMGDLDQVNQQLATISKELDALNVEKQKFKNYMVEAQSQLNTPISDISSSPRSARPHNRPLNRPDETSSPASSISSKTQSLPVNCKPPGSSPNRNVASGVLAVQRSSYSEDSISSDGSFNTHGGSSGQLPQKSVSRSNVQQTLPGASPESGYGADENAANPNQADSVYNECDSLPILGHCTALYAFDGGSEGTLRVSDGEEMLLIEKDEGDGWTRVRDMKTNEEGFVPSSYLHCKWYPTD